MDSKRAHSGRVGSRETGCDKKSIKTSSIFAACVTMLCLFTPVLGAEVQSVWLSSEKPPPGTPLKLLSAPDSESALDGSNGPSSQGGGTVVSQGIAGSALRPRDSVVDFDVLGSGGCIYAENNASDVFNAPIRLPQGTNVDTMRMYYHDTSASNSTAWFTVYDMYGTIVEEWAVTSSGEAGEGFNDSATIGHAVNNNQYFYMLNWRPVISGTEMQLCGFRVFHTPPSPLVFFDRFEQH